MKATAVSAVYLTHASGLGLFEERGRPVWAVFKSSRTGLLRLAEWQ